MTLMDKVRGIVFKRRQAYRAIFQPGNVTSPAAEIVLTDLRKFCRVTSTPAVVSPVSAVMDPMATGVAIGRLEVWHRIAQHLHISDADLYRLVERNEAGTE